MTDQELKKILEKSQLETSSDFANQLIDKIETIEVEKKNLNFPYHFILWITVIFFASIGFTYIYTNTFLLFIPKLPFLLLLSFGILVVIRHISKLKASHTLVMEAYDFLE